MFSGSQKNKLLGFQKVASWRVQEACFFGFQNWLLGLPRSQFSRSCFLSQEAASWPKKPKN